MKVRVRHRPGKPSSNHPHFLAPGWPGGAALRLATCGVSELIMSEPWLPFLSILFPLLLLTLPPIPTFLPHCLTSGWPGTSSSWGCLSAPDSPTFSSQGQGPQVCSPHVKSCLPHLPLFMLPSWQIKIVRINCVFCLLVLMDNYVKTLLLLGPELLSSLLTADTCCPVDFSQEEMGHRV